MRFLHTADWHLGRYFHGLHLTEEQRYLLTEELIPLVRAEGIEAVVIAGDIYDRGVPPVEAVALFDEVLTHLIEQKVKVLYIAGNHDSARRLQFGSTLMEQAGVFVQGELTAEPVPVVLEDEHGPVYFSLLPYAEPAAVRSTFGVSEVLDFGSASDLVVQAARARIPAGARSVAVAHAFIAGGAASESERPLAVGGAANVAPGIFTGYNYTALGHLHNPQRAGGETIRYSGSLLKYSFDEAEQKKGVNIVDIDGAGSVTQRFIELHPRHDVRRLSGEFDAILRGAEYPASDDFIEVVLTDHGPVLEANSRLREKFPNLMHVAQDYRVAGTVRLERGENVLRRSELELFSQYYEQQTGEPMTDEQSALLKETIQDIYHEEAER